jgi:hypothetical protein
MLLNAVLRPFCVAGVGLFVLGANQTMAQTCQSGSRLNQSAITTLLEGQYACGASGGQTWDERHSGGLVLDYKKGPTDPVDPSDTTSHPTGSYAYGASGTDGTVTYTYGGAPAAYFIQSAGGSSYYFCPIGGTGSVLNITVQASHCY